MICRPIRDSKEDPALIQLYPILILRLQRLSATTYVIPDGTALLQGLTDVLVSVLNSDGHANGLTKTFQKYFDQPGQYAGNFVVEENLRRNLWMMVTSPGGLEQVKFFEVTSPTGVRHHLPGLNNDIVHHQFPGLEEAGIWSYKFQVQLILMDALEEFAETE